MKRSIIIIALCSVCVTVKAQSLGGIFSQGQDKIKIMLQQIAAYATYLNELKQGYQEAQKGLGALHDLKNGTLGLHQNYISSLSAVSPAVKSDPKIKGITDLQQKIIAVFDQSIAWQKKQGLLNADEISSIQQVYNTLLIDCNKDLDELTLVVTPGKMQMQDAQRIQAIDHLYADMLQRYNFSGSFTHQAYNMATSRDENKNNNNTIQQLYP